MVAPVLEALIALLLGVDVVGHMDFLAVARAGGADRGTVSGLEGLEGGLDASGSSDLGSKDKRFKLCNLFGKTFLGSTRIETVMRRRPPAPTKRREIGLSNLPMVMMTSLAGRRVVRRWNLQAMPAW